ncbi:4-hydroxy-tetrahydrodipicolinate reductase [Candidatus Poribacteria bacterium]|nr:4-hydroxy-tetrahydrodipicolinate reductase [Candidatus Poribacteria bacterium]MYF55499.1 4-hydroxy-tetrahydrodipicolinate reductase [Candidatus Poribacteria bacterium]MYI94320.1 4-hydroxy-tetrahydrodipicolinate reductase [Candidatus Poribacteria bacterium]
MINVTINGACGRMGRLIIQGVTEQGGVTLVGAIEFPQHPEIGSDAGVVAGIGEIGVPISAKLSDTISESDVVIEFSKPEATLQHLRQVVEADKAMVIATTGFSNAELDEVKDLASKIRCVMAPNMSLGVNVMIRALELIAKSLGDDYDIEIIEAHHNHKADSPSGTALRLAETVATALERDLDEVGVYGRHGIIGPRPEKQIGIHAIRGGDIAGDHTVMFATQGEQLSVVHRAHSPEAFAKGAIRAAKWVVNASRGLHDVSEVLFENTQ